MSALLIPGILANNRFMQPVDQYYEWYKANQSSNLANLIRDNQKTLETVRILADTGLLINTLLFWNVDMGRYHDFVTPNYYLRRIFNFTTLSWYPTFNQTTASIKPVILSNGIDSDGVDDGMGIAGGLSTVADSFSFGGWFKPNKTITVVSETQTGATGTTGQNYSLYPLLNGDITGSGVSIGTNAIQVFEHAAGYLPCHASYTTNLGNTWHHIIVVYNNKQALIYLDGSLVRTGLTSQRSNVYCSIAIAIINTYGLWKGTLNDVCAFNKALSATEVSNLYTLTTSKYA
jgi:hypothetical protein